MAQMYPSQRTEWTDDDAIEAFNADMSNACDDGDRKQATQWLAERIGDAKRAENMREAWMIQYRQSNREI